MKILADECVDKQIVGHLRKDGHDVKYVAEMSPGIMDEEVLYLANEEDTLLLTADKDFGESIFRQGLVKKWDSFVSPFRSFITRKAELISSVITEHGDELLKAFSVITEKAVRIRKV